MPAWHSVPRHSPAACVAPAPASCARAAFQCVGHRAGLVTGGHWSDHDAIRAFLEVRAGGRGGVDDMLVMVRQALTLALVLRVCRVGSTGAGSRAGRVLVAVRHGGSARRCGEGHWPVGVPVHSVSH